MTDAHHVPPELQNLLMVVVGNKWPTGDEAALRAEAASWRHVATTLQACTQDVAEVRKHVDTGLEGATREAIDQFLTTLLGRSGDDDSAVLPAIVRCCDDAADALDDQANEIETLRIEIIGALIVLAIQLMVDATVLFFFGGLEAAAAEITAARVLCLSFLRKAVTRALTRVAEAVVAQEGFALLAQVIELAQHHRRSLDGSQLEVAAVNGAVGGAVGFGAGLLGGALGHGLGKGVRAAGLGALGRGTADLVWQGGYSALAGMAEGAAQDAAFGLSGDYVSGAANGSFSGVWGSRHTAMNPKNLGSISPADHLEGKLDGILNPPVQVTGGGSSSSGRPPVVDTPPNSPVPLRREATGLEGPEAWQDVDGSAHEHVPALMASFEPGDNPWADDAPDEENGGALVPSDQGSEDLFDVYDNPWADSEPGDEGFGTAHPQALGARPGQMPPGWEDPWSLTDTGTAPAAVVRDIP
ncbi:hypothetical protein ACFZAR_34870 [Streptomyces sp. NPDC008222]|uniref:WXG100-like domain-containing protein n=1 Tax=Streptomyces sp. NPDC008222 TaxID=3364820 RepID=UPI0036E80650